jgi:hypothetical protein
MMLQKRRHDHSTAASSSGAQKVTKNTKKEDQLQVQVSIKEKGKGKVLKTKDKDIKTTKAIIGAKIAVCVCIAKGHIAERAACVYCCLCALQ